MWMKLEGIMLSEINQTEKDKYCTVSLQCEILKRRRKQVELIETESLMEVGEIERYWLKGANFHL